MSNRRDFNRGVATGTLAAWITPTVSIVSLPAHAQTSPPCISEPPFGILVTVVDSSTGTNISCICSGTLNDGTVTTDLLHQHPTLPPSPTCNSPTLGGAINRPGTYSLQITAPGYISHSQNGIVVVAEECFTNTVNVNVSLQPV